MKNIIIGYLKAKVKREGSCDKKWKLISCESEFDKLNWQNNTY